jgi:hypothetical protein
MNALVNSLGIAAGNAGLLAPLCLLCIMPIMYLILKVPPFFLLGVPLSMLLPPPCLWQMDHITPLKDEYSEEEVRRQPFSHKFSHLLPSPLSSLLDFKHKQSPRGGPPEGTLISPPLATHHDFKIRDGKVRGIPEKSTLKTIVRGRQSRSGRTGLGLGGRGGRNNPHPLCLPVCRAGEGSEL